MKTLAELEALTDDELRVMLAELVGYVHRPDGAWQESGRVGSCGIPNYPQDLNACHAVENSLGDEYPTHNREWFRKQLRKVCNHPSHTHEVHATARQRTIALILTLQKP